MSGIESAPQLDDEKECPVCGSTGTLVEYDNDIVCTECAYTPEPAEGPSSTSDPWGEWHEHRAAEYEGFYGDDRIRMVGGFVSAYEFGDDFSF